MEKEKEKEAERQEKASKNRRYTSFEEARAKGCGTRFIEHVVNVTETLTNLADEGKTGRAFMVFALDEETKDDSTSVGLIVCGSTVEKMAVMLSAAMEQNFDFQMAMMIALMKRAKRM